ncbi:MAG: type I-E CRISPR-associated protein Cas7/Cse4/CasC, partial [Candidatus Eisenbacteria bacterium]|nr:type I-E CRISPR-associated protein Cas7/Cse4/CasC [Candidatus Eisenbacteria bacterium]
LKGILGREGKKNLQALKMAAGLDAALFGRMVTSDILSRGDAAVHVAHAFTVHAEASEADYFSAVDDLLSGDEELGSGHIGSVELTSGLFYGYVVLDLPLLVSNLEGCPTEEWEGADHDLASRVVQSLANLVARVSPGAKLGSTAPYSYAHLLLVETGSAQPRTLANAFLDPVPSAPGMLRNTYQALGRYIADLDSMYGAPTARRLAASGPVEDLTSQTGIERVTSLDELSGWLAARVRGEDG